MGISVNDNFQYNLLSAHDYCGNHDVIEINNQRCDYCGKS